MIDYDTAVSEGWYKGTLDEYLKFTERCVLKRKFYPDEKLTQELRSEKKKSFSNLYSTALQLYYRGTVEDFRYMLDKYIFGFLGTPGDRGCIG